MKLLKRIGIGLAIVLALLAVVVATRPAKFHIERSAVVKASPAAVHAVVNDFHAWKGWSPWDKLDPAMTRTFSGPVSGKDAAYAWVGNKDVGEGKMTITDSTPDKITIRLEFIKPFAETNITTFTFVSSGAETKVTWAMDGENDFMGKAFSLVMDMEKMVGPDFEKGLAAMKAMAESAPAAPAPAATP
jgi:hypothetical protein